MHVLTKQEPIENGVDLQPLATSPFHDLLNTVTVIGHAGPLKEHLATSTNNAHITFRLRDTIFHLKRIR